MLKRYRRILGPGLLVVIGLSGCAKSVVLLQPAENNSQRVVTQNAQGEIDLQVRFHSRANQGTFEAEWDPGTASATGITNAFPATGDTRNATIAVTPGQRSLRLYARMSPGQAFDSLGRTYSITVNPTPPPPPPPPPPPGPRVDMTVTRWCPRWYGETMRLIRFSLQA